MKNTKKTRIYHFQCKNQQYDTTNEFSESNMLHASSDKHMERTMTKIVWNYDPFCKLT